jgi:hypothetical protein
MITWNLCVLCGSRTNSKFCLIEHQNISVYNQDGEVFTARYGLSPYITELRFVFKR